MVAAAAGTVSNKPLMAKQLCSPPVSDKLLPETRWSAARTKANRQIITHRDATAIDLFHMMKKMKMKTGTGTRETKDHHEIFTGNYFHTSRSQDPSLCVITLIRSNHSLIATSTSMWVCVGGEGGFIKSSHPRLQTFLPANWLLTLLLLFIIFRPGKYNPMRTLLLLCLICFGFGNSFTELKIYSPSKIKWIYHGFNSELFYHQPTHRIEIAQVLINKFFVNLSFFLNKLTARQLRTDWRFTRDWSEEGEPTMVMVLYLYTDEEGARIHSIYLLAIQDLLSRLLKSLQFCKDFYRIN